MPARSQHVTPVAEVARHRQQQAGDVTIDSRVSLRPTGDRAWKLAVILDVALPSVGDRATRGIAEVPDGSGSDGLGFGTRSGKTQAVKAAMMAQLNGDEPSAAYPHVTIRS
jgi:hypothetical protein